MRVNWEEAMKKGLFALKPFVSSYLEGKYDNLFKTEFGKKLRDIDKETKGGFGVALGVLFGILDSIETENALKEFATDLGYDGAARIITRLRKEQETPENILKAEMILELEPEILEKFIKWAAEIDSEQRKVFFKIIHDLDLDDNEITKLIEMDSETQRMFIKIIQPAESAKEKKNIISPELRTKIDTMFSSFRQTTEKAKEGLRTRVEKKRQERKERRRG